MNVYLVPEIIDGDWRSRLKEWRNGAGHLRAYRDESSPWTVNDCQSNVILGSFMERKAIEFTGN